LFQPEKKERRSWLMRRLLKKSKENSRRSKERTSLQPRSRQNLISLKLRSKLGWRELKLKLNASNKMRKKERKRGLLESLSKRDKSWREIKFACSRSKKERRLKKGSDSKTSRSKRVSNSSKEPESRPN